jgi:hypothetical protein
MAGEDQDRINRRSAHIYESTLKEIAGEKAASLGRAGRRLEDALARLSALDRAGSTERIEMVEEAGEALYFYIVQREACGLFDSSEIFRELSVPDEVRRRMGLRKRRR